MRRRLFLLSLMASLILHGSCGKTPKDEAETGPEYVENIPILDYAYVVIGDTVEVGVTIYTADYLYLYSEKPVEIYAPSNSPFTFEKKVYTLDPGTMIMPVRVSFKVTPKTQEGKFLVRLPMRLKYKNKSDNQPQTRIEIISVPVKVVKKRSSRRGDVAFPVEYTLK